MTPTLQAAVDVMTVVSNLMVLAFSSAAIFIGWPPLRELIARQEDRYDRVLRGQLLMKVRPRSATVASIIVIFLLAVLGHVLTGSFIGSLLLGGAGVFIPVGVLTLMLRRRLRRLEDQLVSGIQTIASGVRAGLNLVQAMQLVGRDGPVPLRQEIRHLLQEYEYGLTFEAAMNNAADRIGSSDYRLLFAALHTHRERGGDLGETLDRIAESVREIQRLERRVETLTAQGRATARWLGAMPVVVLVILFFLVDPAGVEDLFTNDMGKLMLLAMLVLNIIGFLWVRKIVDVDI
ncbi:hypothetical protein LCGC14_0302390 [marine sediment metagenome]|uniref:Type II secretion system protein GspF domain-containing protein n=1 Tax=marine sediment metagenome TaxID=412755 RepID=A0A0F9TPY0_9ZZZZ|nr:hypothetical protein [Phycisphaerae bacterium]HDZ43000.1 hypothetical protein [Phycisphaerae bacterium]